MSTTTVQAAHGRIAALRFGHNPNGQIDRVWRNDQLLAQYRYNSRAQRIEKTLYDPTGAVRSQTQFLYDSTDKLIAEADAQGQIQRQYLYLGHHPVALLSSDQTYAIHCNHLGAPIALTDAQQRVVWRADYAPFGRAQVDEDPDGDGISLSLHLRLPGQYEDTETGLYDNHHRVYDPDLGRYLSVDPLGLGGGINPYTYAANDPVNHIDPSGLLLFAFDGTGNNNPPEKDISDISNVVRFAQSYADPDGMGPEYISGTATKDSRSGIYGGPTDGATGASMLKRVRYMANRFFEHVMRVKRSGKQNATLAIDTVGFSRGAASARIFTNLLYTFLEEKKTYFELEKSKESERYYFNQGIAAEAREAMRCANIKVNLRFLGLWDTVPHYGLDQDNDLAELHLEIPEIGQVYSTAHAIAANEDREDFHGISIHDSRYTHNTWARGEQGFIGAHSDIGGGYSEGDLSDVAFMWMVGKAQDAGLEMKIADEKWTKVLSPVVHDSVGVSPAPGIIFGSGREFKYLNNTDRETQKQWDGWFPANGGQNMNYARSVTYFDQQYMEDREDCSAHGHGEQMTVTCETTPKGQKGLDKGGQRTLVGMVNEKGASTYSDWLRTNYGLNISIQMSELRIGDDGKPLGVYEKDNDNRKP